MDAGTFLGVDIGKSGHYAVAVDAAGKPIYQTAVANDESALRKLVDWATEHQASVVVDQPGGAAGLLLKLCWQADVRIGYLHGLAMARAREFYAGQSKTDPKDAFVLADVARAHSVSGGLARAEQRSAGAPGVAVRLRRGSARRCQSADQSTSGAAGGPLAGPGASVRRAAGHPRCVGGCAEVPKWTGAQESWAWHGSPRR